MEALELLVVERGSAMVAAGVINQDLVKYSSSYHSREQIYAENLVSILAILSRMVHSRLQSP